MGLSAINSGQVGQVSIACFLGVTFVSFSFPLARGRCNLENPSFAGWGTVA